MEGLQFLALSIGVRVPEWKPKFMNNTLEVVDLQKHGKEYLLTTSFNEKSFTYPIEVIDNDGLLGYSFPDELSIILRNELNVKQTQVFVSEISKKYRTLL